MPHQRRKSGHGHSGADTRKSDSSRQVRPTISRRYTPTTIQRSSRTPRYESSSEDESFPQFCMSCEKQFLPASDNFLYCSESCRRSDQSSHSASYSSYSGANDYSLARRQSYYGSDSEPKDIIPQASPSRPGSMLLATSPPATPGTYYGSKPESALSALRSLTAIHPPSPPSPTSSAGGFWLFGKSTATSPSSSYARPYMMETSHTYHGSTDRPLPSRSSRPKSTELVTPITGR
ncbi:hypothetical protein LEL_04952 [Akanthomyces lecanii RCEF 1005]|uniref:Life-span regulatory factor n=1 Tax=Akanthomyces lecanii RCEF 1005 TaxID=1081108 RepID=A0A168HR87_CORDF|nr:hypothetical protein LEL_04952 [Akanthomyces lecanii RCEF 1005]